MCLHAKTECPNKNQNAYEDAAEPGPPQVRVQSVRCTRAASPRGGK
jgi:hypothetical protein